MSAEQRIVENPFLVLGLAPDASRIEVERESQKLLGMLELGLEAAKAYATPLGMRQRTPELVRAAAATLRDPERRLVAEVWARGMVPMAAPAMGTTATGTDADEDDPPGGDPPCWLHALREAGWSLD